MGCILGVNAGCTTNIRRLFQLDILIRMFLFFECACCQRYFHDRESTAACLMTCEGYYFVLLVLGNAAK